METKNTSEARIVAILSASVEKAQKEVAEFTERLATPHHAAYAFEWADSAMRAAAFLEIALPFLNAAKKEEKKLEIVAAAKRIIERCESHLLGDGAWAGEGPWRHNSSSASSNLMNIERANAHREMRALLVSALQEDERGL